MDGRAGLKTQEFVPQQGEKYEFVDPYDENNMMKAMGQDYWSFFRQFINKSGYVSASNCSLIILVVTPMKIPEHLQAKKDEFITFLRTCSRYGGIDPIIE
jgi:hypothetical protein